MNLRLVLFISYNDQLKIQLLVFRKKDLYLVITQKLTFLISWNLADFRWNLPDFTPEICQISRVKSRWNPPDFERPIARNGKPYVSAVRDDSFDDFTAWIFVKFFRCIIVGKKYIPTWLSTFLVNGPTELKNLTPIKKETLGKWIDLLLSSHLCSTKIKNMSELHGHI